MITERELALRLEKYLPAGVETDVARWIAKSRVHFRVNMPRNSVYGDYMHPHGGKGHRITVNGNLNKFSFFITTAHEFAHLNTYEKFGNYVKSHGEEWKTEFKLILWPYLRRGVFPDDVDLALQRYMKNPAASSCTDGDLMKTLKNYDLIKSVFIEEIPENARFKLNNKVFIKGKKIRTRFECLEIKTGHVYLVGQSTEISPIE